MKFDGSKLEQALLLYGVSQTRLSVLAKVGRTDINKLISGAKVDSLGAKVTRLVDALNYVERKQATEQGRAPRVWASGDLYDQRHHPEEFDGFKVLDSKGR